MPSNYYLTFINLSIFFSNYIFAINGSMDSYLGLKNSVLMIILLYDPPDSDSC